MDKLNRHIKFWLTIGSLITMVLFIGFLGYVGMVEEFTFKKEYCLFILPNFVYLIFQFIVNYEVLITDKDE